MRLIKVENDATQRTVLNLVHPALEENIVVSGKSSKSADGKLDSRYFTSSWRRRYALLVVQSWTMKSGLCAKEVSYFGNFLQNKSNIQPNTEETTKTMSFLYMGAGFHWPGLYYYLYVYIGSPNTTGAVWTTASKNVLPQVTNASCAFSAQVTVDSSGHSHLNPAPRVGVSEHARSITGEVEINICMAGNENN